jgi:transcriptional regulator GlxA family with amidase domain
MSASVAIEAGPRQGRAAAGVQRAVAYIEANLRAPLTLEDIVRASGISGRGLFRHFRAALGVSPMAWLRDARFLRVREALRHAHRDDRIVEIAALWGFDHMGRFAVEYRRRFGEKPSQTRAFACAGRAAQLEVAPPARTPARHQITNSPAITQPVEMS